MKAVHHTPPAPTTMRALWTQEDVAKYLRVSTRTVGRLTKAKKLPAFRAGRQWRYSPHAIETLAKTGGLA